MVDSVPQAVWNPETRKIEAQLRFGGRGRPAFKLEWSRGCFETMPLQADARVVQIAGDDDCERLNHKLVEFSLQGDPCGGGHPYVNLSGGDGEDVRVEITR